MKALSISRLTLVVGLALGTMVFLTAVNPNIVSGSNLSIGGRTTGHDGEDCKGTTDNVSCEEVDNDCFSTYIRCDTTSWPTQCGKTCSCKTTSQTCGGGGVCWDQCDAKCS